MADSIYVGNKVMSFKKKPRMSAYDMVIINVSDEEVITSPYVTIDKDTWLSHEYENGIYEIKYNGTAWIRTDTGTTFNLADSGITVTYSDATGVKAGDTVTVEQLSNTTTRSGEEQTEYTVNIELTRSGNTLETENPFATQAMADSMLAHVIGYAYQPYEAGGVILNPAAELGDAITAYGLYGGLYSEELTYSRLMAPSIGAPGDADAVHEYSYVDANDRKYKRQIGSKVSRINGDGSAEFSWEMMPDHFVIRATVNGVVTPMLYIDKDGATFAGTVRANRIETGTIIVDGKTISAGYIQGSQIGTGTITGGNSGNIGSGTVAYGNTSFTGTLDQVSLNASAIGGLNDSINAIWSEWGFFDTLVLNNGGTMRFHGTTVGWITVDGKSVLGHSTD